MKSIFYIGAFLMVGAGIYGFVDYSKVNQSKEFKTLYEEKEIKDPDENNAVGVEIDPRSIVKASDPVSIKEEPMRNIYSTGGSSVLPAKEESKVVAKGAPKKQKMKKKKKFSSKLFSRAAMEKFEVPEVVADEPVAEVITEKKEQ